MRQLTGKAGLLHIRPRFTCALRIYQYGGRESSIISLFKALKNAVYLLTVKVTFFLRMDVL